MWPRDVKKVVFRALIVSPARGDGALRLVQIADRKMIVYDRPVVRPPWTCRYVMIAESFMWCALSADSHGKHLPRKQ